MSGKTAEPFTPRQERIGSVIVKIASQVNTWLYRLSGGRIAGRFPSGAPVLLLTTMGRKTGQPRPARISQRRLFDGPVRLIFTLPPKYLARICESFAWRLSGLWGSGRWDSRSIPLFN
jgi:hypothetical protein